MLRSNVVVALGTALSRFTGMLRVLVFGIVIGQTAVADAYGGANDAPNVVYELLLGGREGPRFGTFVAPYGIPETRALSARALSGELSKGAA